MHHCLLGPSVLYYSLSIEIFISKLFTTYLQYFILGKGLFPTAATFGCCNIGTKLSKVTNGYDCLIIPGEKINRRATQKL